MKEELRNNAKKTRDKLMDAAKAGQLRDNFIRNIDLGDVSTISCYWPVGSEIDVRPLINKLYQDGHNICLPCIVAPGEPLIFREWEPEAVMVKSKFGIFEPCHQHHAETIPSMLIVPLLAFDHRRHRLGYGGGYYDRTIEKLRKEKPDLIAIGVAYSGQILDQIPNQDWDVQLDKIVTEKSVYR